MPKEFEREVIKTVRGTDKLKTKTFTDAPGRKEYRERVLTMPDGSQCTSITSQKWSISPELEQWIKHNVYNGPWVDVGINSHNNVSTVMGPHVDDIKREIILYVVETGGSDVETVWWQEQGFPVERVDKLPINNNGIFYTSTDDYSKLTELERVCLPPGKWVRMNTVVLHSVENITGVRTIVKIGLD
jgi:hypothetical protein